MLLLNSPLYGPGPLCALTRTPRTGGEPRAERERGAVQSATEDERLEKTEGEEKEDCKGEVAERFNAASSPRA